MRKVRITLLALVVAGVAAPVAALFPIILQRVCDPDTLLCNPPTAQGLRGVRQIALSPDGENAYAVSSLDKALLVFSVDAGSGKLTLVESFFDTDAGIDGLDSARGVAVSPDGENVYVAALLDSSISWYDRDSGDGTLTFNDIIKDTDPGIDGLAGANAVVVSPDDEHVYVAARSEDEVSVFSRSTASGDLAFVEIEKDGSGGVDGLDAPEGLAISPDGEHLYVASEDDNAVAVFERETSMGGDFGKLTFLEAKKEGVGGVDGMTGAGTVTVSPDGENVYVGSSRGAAGGDWAAVFTRDDDSMSGSFGELTLVQDLQEEDFGPYPACSGVGPDNTGVAATADDERVLLTNTFRGVVAIFDRSGLDGSLTLAHLICDEEFGLAGIGGAMAITVNGDSNRAYVASSSFEQLAVLCIDPDDDVDLSDSGSITVDTTEVGCRSLIAGGDVTGYEIRGGAKVLFQSAQTKLVDGFGVVDGEFSATDRAPSAPVF